MDEWNSLSTKVFLTITCGPMSTEVEMSLLPL